MMQADFDRAIARLPKWMFALGALGTGAAGWMGGFGLAGPFLVGAVAAYFNLRLIERTVDRLGEAAKAGTAKPRKRAGVGMFIQFALFILGAFVILRFSGFNLTAAFLGFLVCPAAAVLEMVYELLTYGHS